jgi:hypothetical protein
MSRAGRVRERERLEAVRLKPVESGSRCCAWPGCEADGTHRAPVARDRLREFQYLCLDHVREFNRRWDFFAGMSVDEIAAHQRADTTWHRPTWRFGTSPGAEPRWHDAFGLFGDGPAKPRRHGASRPQQQRPPTKAEQMMAVLELEDGFTLSELKSRYKALAKRHHPDLHGGDKAAEERLKQVIEAYTYLREQRLYA